MELWVLDRATGKKCEEQIYGLRSLKFLYRGSRLSRLCLHLCSKYPWVSALYGRLQSTRLSRYKIKPFIVKYQLDASEFLEPVSSFRSFNDFFIRKLKAETRPVDPHPETFVLPADGRYRVFPRLELEKSFLVKGHAFSLATLLGSEELAKKYALGAMCIARLAPVDYHRFHFPASCTPGHTQEIGGSLYSVNPLALEADDQILAKNKRALTLLSTPDQGDILFLEVGATHVGSIHQTFTPHRLYQKGEEKGFFSFGGSCIILLFERGKIEFAPDLLAAASERLEVLGRMGQPLGVRA